MRTPHSKLFRYCTIAACAVVVANGCRLERRPIINIGRVVPAQYCVGDTLTASYDFLRADTCTGTPEACDMNRPVVTLSSTPALFPTETVTAYQHSIPFTASGDSVDVRFDFPATEVRIPTSITRGVVPDETQRATRITSPVPTTLAHGSDCTGGVPRYFPVEVPRLPRYSPNVVLLRVINANGVRVRYIIPSTVVGESPYTAELDPGGMIDTSMPGVPAGIRGAMLIEAIPTGLICTPGSGTVDGSPRAPPLNTQVITGCP
ncbi:MAG: hypothetical protein ABL934_14690 [Lysobacteraceae bacterium]